jgi:hypothetical protein
VCHVIDKGGQHDGDLHLPPPPHAPNKAWAVQPLNSKGQAIPPGDLLQYTKVKGAIQCCHCFKYRQFCTNYKLSEEQKTKLGAFVADITISGSYSCGADLTQAAVDAGLDSAALPWTRLNSGATKSSIPFTCTQFVEQHLYAYKEFESACSVCGTLGSPPPADETTLPLCSRCDKRGFKRGVRTAKKKDVMALALPPAQVPNTTATADATATANPTADTSADATATATAEATTAPATSEATTGKRGADTQLLAANPKYPRVADKAKKTAPQLTFDIPVHVVDQDLTNTAADLIEQRDRAKSGRKRVRSLWLDEYQ